MNIIPTKYLITLFLLITINMQGFQNKDPLTQEQLTTALDSVEYWIENDYITRALKEIDKVESAAVLSRNQHFIARAYRLRSAVALYVNDYKTFKSYLDKASDWQDTVQDPYGEVFVNNLKGLYYKKVTKDLDQAIVYFNKAVEAGNKPAYEEQIIDIYFNLTSILYSKKEWDACYKMSQKAIRLAEKYTKNSRLVRLYYYCGVACANTDRFDEALDYYKKGEQIALQEIDTAKTVNKTNYVIYLSGLANLYDRKKDYKVANQFYQKYFVELAHQNNAFLEKYSNMMKSYKNLQLREKESEKMLVEYQYQQTQLKLNKYLIFLGIGIIIALIFVILLQYTNSKLKTENNKLLKQKNAELQLAKEKVEDAYAKKTLFVNNITHELRTPLHAITGIAHLLEQENTNREQHKRHLKILQFSGKYLLRFVNDIIDINTTETSEKTTLKKVDIDVNKFINTIRESISYFITGEYNNSFDFVIDKALPKTIISDPDSLARVIISLLSHVAKNTENGNILLAIKSLDTDTSDCRILFSTNCKNLYLPEERIQELKKSFTEGNSAIFTALSDKHNHSAVELVMANKLLLQFDSSLDLSSDKENGSTFSFIVDFASPDKKIKKKEEVIVNKDGVKILIVEDNRINQLITCKIINNFGYYCEVVSNGYEALEKTEQESYDLILMDIMMDGIDGFETTRRIRKKGINTPIIALTAISKEENKHFFEEVGINTVINKPFEPSMLRIQIENSLT